VSLSLDCKVLNFGEAPKNEINDKWSEMVEKLWPRYDKDKTGVLEK
jgi:hypothetical protein